MNVQDSPERDKPPVREVEPDYQAWVGFDEAPKSALVEFSRYLGRRSFYEVSAIASTVALAYIGGRIISGGGSNLPTPQGSFCLMAITLLIFTAPILYHFYYSVCGGWSHAQAAERSQDPPELGNERSGEGNARRAPS